MHILLVLVFFGLPHCSPESTGMPLDSNSCINRILRQKCSVVRDVFETACLLSWSWGLPMHVAASGMLRSQGADETVRVSPTQYFLSLTIEPLPQHLLTSRSTLGFWGNCLENNRLDGCKIPSEFMISQASESISLSGKGQL